ncbi:hypothetical protein GQ457_05G021480 [Hibiscus cannabinus]
MANGSGSRGCESRVRPSLGLRKERLASPSSGDRNPHRCRQDLARWLELSGRYKGMVFLESGKGKGKNTKVWFFCEAMGHGFSWGLRVDGVGYQQNWGLLNQRNEIQRYIWSGLFLLFMGRGTWKWRERSKWFRKEEWEGIRVRWNSGGSFRTQSWFPTKAWGMNSETILRGERKKTITCVREERDGGARVDNSGDWATWELLSVMGPTRVTEGTFSKHYSTLFPPEIRQLVSRGIDDARSLIGNEGQRKGPMIIFARPLFYYWLRSLEAGEILGVQILRTLIEMDSWSAGPQISLMKGHVTRFFTLSGKILHGVKKGYAWITYVTRNKREELALVRGGTLVGVLPTVDMSIMIIQRRTRIYLPASSLLFPKGYFLLRKGYLLGPALEQLDRVGILAVMADGVTGLMENLKFSEEELMDASTGEEDMIAMAEGAEKWVVGKLISPSIADSGLLIRESKEAVLNRCPWSFDGELLALKPFDAMLSPGEYNFHPLCIWARIYQVPLGLMNQQTGEKIGNKMGTHKAVDLREGDGRLGEFLRIRTEIDSSKPLRRTWLGNMPRKTSDFQGPFQFGEWLKVDLSQGRQNVRRKPGIVYVDSGNRNLRMEQSEEHSMAQPGELQEEGRCLSIGMDKGKTTGPATSSMGRETLIKAVAQALPTYAMQVFLLLDCILDPIIATMRRFWWSGKANERGWAHVAWSKLCRPKGARGMGFGNLKQFNIALLGKQMWKVFTCKDSLCFKVLSAKYFPTRNIMEATLKDKSSYVWNSILKAKDALREGFYWRIWIDSNVCMFQQPWGGDSRIVLEDNYLDSQMEPIRCKEFMVEGRALWDISKVNHVFSEEDAKKILACPIIPGREDVLVWGQHHSRQYVTRTGHHWLEEQERTESSRSKLWCKMCERECESTLHALRECTTTHEVFACCGLDKNLPQGPFESGEQWLEEVIRIIDPEQFPLFLILIWNIWNRRNRWVHQNQLIPAKMVADYAQLLAGEVQKPADASTLVTTRSGRARWQKPDQGKVKINVDGAWSPERRLAAIGVVVRDHNGLVLDARARRVEGVHTPETIEACAFGEEVKVAIEQGWQNVILEEDSSLIAAQLCAPSLDRSLVAAHLRETWNLLRTRPNIIVQHTRRDGNRAAHSLAHLMFQAVEPYVFDLIIPSCIYDIVIDDAIYG